MYSVSKFLFEFYDCRAPAFLTPLHSLNGPVGQPFASRLGAQRFTLWGCTHTLELGSLVGDVSLHW
jgi:hypothetical protein